MPVCYSTIAGSRSLSPFLHSSHSCFSQALLSDVPTYDKELPLLA